jgi:hypothetical protein
LDSAGSITVFSFALRQSQGIGTLRLDDLKVGTAFTDVSEPRYRLTITKPGDNVVVSWPPAATAAGYKLQHNPTLAPGGWLDVDPMLITDNSLTLTNPSDGNFFQLVK